MPGWKVRREVLPRGGGRVHGAGRVTGARPARASPSAVTRSPLCPALSSGATEPQLGPPRQAGSQGSRPRLELNISPPPHAHKLCLLQATSGLVPTSSSCPRTPPRTPPGTSPSPRRPPGTVPPPALVFRLRERGPGSCRGPTVLGVKLDSRAPGLQTGSVHRDLPTQVQRPHPR